LTAKACISTPSFFKCFSEACISCIHIFLVNKMIGIAFIIHPTIVFKYAEFAVVIRIYKTIFNPCRQVPLAFEWMCIIKLGGVNINIARLSSFLLFSVVQLISLAISYGGN